MSAGPMRAGLMPALLTRPSIRPNRWSTPSTKTGIASHSPTWQASPSTSAPVALATSFATSSHSSCFRLLTTTDAPARAMPSTIARPIPLVEPVTITTFPVRSNSSAVSRSVIVGSSSRACREWVTGAGEALLDVAAHEPVAQFGVDVVECVAVQLDGLGVALEVRVVRRPHELVGQLREHLERVRVTEPWQRGGTHVATEHVAARDVERPLAECGRRQRLAFERGEERRHPVHPHLLEHHREVGVAGEHAAVEHPGDQVLRCVHALRVGETHEATDSGAAVETPADVGPPRKVGFGVAHVDD